MGDIAFFFHPGFSGRIFVSSRTFHPSLRGWITSIIASFHAVTATYTFFQEREFLFARFVLGITNKLAGNGSRNGSVMTDRDPEDTVNQKDTETLAISPESCVPQGMTMEAMIDLTGEMEHLNELVMLHIEKEGGFTSTASYFAMVQPVLDLLEFEIRIRSYPGMTQKEMKLVIQDWIDEEIAERKRKKK
jgi:hypothetical protein